LAAWPAEFGLLYFGLVVFENLAGFFEIEEVTVDDELPFAGVRRDLMDSLDCVAVVSKLFYEKVDVDHAGKCTGGLSLVYGLGEE
jgi:hypothetical protein